MQSEKTYKINQTNKGETILYEIRNNEHKQIGYLVIDAKEIKELYDPREVTIK